MEEGRPQTPDHKIYTEKSLPHQLQCNTQYILIFRIALCTTENREELSIYLVLFFYVPCTRAYLLYESTLKIPPESA